MSNKYPQNKTAHTTGESTGASKRKTNGYSFVVQRAKRNARRAEAEERFEYHQGLTVEQRIAKAKKRRGNSKRELARLEGLLTTEKAAKKSSNKKA